MENLGFEHFCNFDALYNASYKVCRNVRWKDSTASFEENRIEIILDTEEKLKSNKYEQQVFSCFSIIERGKQRDIRACHINDRLVQNALCEEILLPVFTPHFIYDNCATLKNKGIDFALMRAKKHLQAAHREYGDFFGLRIDIRKYFDSINHEALKDSISKLIKDEQILKLCYDLVDTFSFKITKDIEPIANKDYFIIKEHKYSLIHPESFKKDIQYFEYEEKSLGLGSQTSQLFALLTLNEIDHFVKEKLHIKYYGRYMDDIYLLHGDKKYLDKCKIEIEKKLAEIGLSLNQKKTVISKVPTHGKNGVPFKYLKWNFYLTETNHIIQLPFREKIKKQRKKLRKLHSLFLEGKTTEEDIMLSYLGWRAHIQKGTCFYIIQNMDNYFRSLFKGVFKHEISFTQQK